MGRCVVLKDALFAGGNPDVLLFVLNNVHNPGGDTRVVVCFLGEGGKCGFDRIIDVHSIFGA